MIGSGLGRRLGVMLAITALCVAAAGCAVDVGTTKERAEGSGQMRYYGGPKSPMWSGQ
jgi:hypothetical protein